MGAYSDYIGKKWNYSQLEGERKKQLERIVSLRKRDILVIAADFTKANKSVSVSLDYNDILAVQDQLATLNGKELDVIIETPGGLAEVAEDIVRLIRDKYEKVAVIIPGWAKSAGTIFAMAGDEILMGKGSALGPIDPQLGYGNGKRFSADAFLEGLDKIKEEVAATGKLNPAYIPILQNISPGEIQNCHNARKFSQALVRTWLVNYKFKYWQKHQSTGNPVTLEEKEKRASEIAAALCDHSKWLTHGRSIKREDLEALRLQVTNYEENVELNDAINRYYILLKMSFDMVNIYKLFETPKTQVVKILTVSPTQPTVKHSGIKAKINYVCPKCQLNIPIQLNLGKVHPIENGFVPYPVENNILKCSQCGAENNLLPIRLQLEAQAGIKAV